MADVNAQEVEITFETPGSSGKAPTLRISDLSKNYPPEKIKQLMDLLELPKGTNARVVYRATDVIVR